MKPPDGACSKRGYPTAHEARVAHRRAGFRLRVYTCPDCHAWHVTNAEKRYNAEKFTDVRQERRR